MYHTTLSDIVKPFYKMAAISKVIRLSQKLRGAAPSMLTLYYRFCGAYIPEKVLSNASCQCIRHFGGHFTKMATIFNVMRLIFEIMGQRNVTVVSTHIIYGQHNSDSALLRASDNCGHNLAGCCGYLF